MEEIAEKVLENAGSCIQEFRVDIERLIETKYEIIIDIFYGLQSKYGVMAFMLIQGKRLFVDDKLIDNPRQAKRYRFTLSEELAHFLIHNNLYKDCKTIVDRIEKESLLTRQEAWFLETNAKALGSAILMPKKLIEKRVDDLISYFGSKPNYTSIIINALAHEFDVNPAAVRRRLRNLGFHKRSNLDLRDNV